VKAGWKVKPLKEVCTLINGRAYKKPELLPEGKYPVLRVGNFFTNDHWYYSDLELEPKKYCDDGDLLYAWSASFGPRIWSGGKVIYHYHIWKVEPDAAQIDRDYLYYFFDWDKELIKKEQGAGATMIHVSKGSMESRAISLPPLDEQKLIVAILGEAFNGLDRARANAVANLVDTGKLFDSFVYSLFWRSQADSNHYRNLGNVCKIQSGAGFPERFQGHESGEIPFYKVSDMNLPGNEQDLVFANNYISDAVRRQLNAKIIPPRAIVFPKVGGAIATNKKRVMGTPGCVDNNVMALIPREEMIQPEYLHEWLRAFNIYEFSNKANPPSITQSTVASWPIILPSQDEQMQIVTSVNELRAHVNSLGLHYRDRLQSTDALRRTLLQKAFSGELT
jgi:type I restriction enzyme S subunit